MFVSVKAKAKKDLNITTMIIIWTNMFFQIIGYVFSSNDWGVIRKQWFHVELTGPKAHSWFDAYNRCSNLKPGNFYPAVIQNQEEIPEYLAERFRKLNINPGDIFIIKFICCTVESI